MTDPGIAAASRARFWDPRRDVQRRSLTLCAVGAMAGLVIAGFGLFTAHGTRSARVPAEDAAIVNTVPILMADYVAQLRTLADVSLAQATPRQRKDVLDGMIREELLVQRGVELGLTSDYLEVRNALASATRSQIASDAMTAKPTERDLHDWYHRHPDTYAGAGVLAMREYVLLSLPAAKAAAAALRAGRSPEALHLRSSGRIDDGDEFYFAARIHLGDALFEIARKMPPGSISDPVAAADGFHILIVDRNTPPMPIGFDEARQQVTADYIADKVAHLQQANETFLRKRADIRIASQFQ